MSHVRMVVACLVCCMALVAAAPAESGTHPHDRNGFMVGFGVGGGGANIDVVDGSEGGGVGNFRIGYAVRPDLAVHLEAGAWTRTFEEAGIGDVTWTFSTTTAALTYFPPPAAGLFFRGGVGVGVADVEADVAGVTVSDSESGFGFLVASGYEWRLTRKFALGPQAEFAYQDLDTLGFSTVFSGALNFNWYW